MKRIICSVIFAVIFASGNGFAQSRSRGEEPPPALTLLEAIEQSAKKVAEDLPQGSRLAIVAFASHNQNISEFIMEELTGALVEQGLEVADRRNLPYLRQEFVFHMSGEVNDESIVRMGNFLGATMVITGGLSGAGNVYRYNVSAIHLEHGTHASSIRLNVRNDEETQRMLDHIIRDPKSEHTIYAEKAEEFRENIETAPASAGMFFDRGIMFSSQHKFEPAIEDLSKAIEEKPEMTSAYMIRGNVHMNAGNVEEAMQDFSRVVEHAPQDALAYATRALRWRGQGDYDRAIADFETALMIEPENTAIREAIVRTYVDRGMKSRGLGNFEKAIADLETALILDPENAGIREALDRLYAGQNRQRAPEPEPVRTHKFALTINQYPDRGGAVFVDPDLPLYDMGTQVNVRAVSADGFRFDGWTGVVMSRNPNVTVTMNRDLALSANFVPVSLQSAPPIERESEGVTRTGLRVGYNASNADVAVYYIRNNQISYDYSEPGLGFELGLVTNTRISPRWSFISGVDLIFRKPVVINDYRDEEIFSLRETGIAVPALIRVGGKSKIFALYWETGIQFDIALSDIDDRNIFDVGFIYGGGYTFGRHVELGSKIFIGANDFVDVPEQYGGNQLIQVSVGLTIMFKGK